MGVVLRNIVSRYFKPVLGIIAGFTLVGCSYVYGGKIENNISSSEPAKTATFTPFQPVTNTPIYTLNPTLNIPTIDSIIPSSTPTIYHLIAATITSSITNNPTKTLELILTDTPVNTLDATFTQVVTQIAPGTAVTPTSSAIAVTYTQIPENTLIATPTSLATSVPTYTKTPTKHPIPTIKPTNTPKPTNTQVPPTPTKTPAPIEPVFDMGLDGRIDQFITQNGKLEPYFYQIVDLNPTFVKICCITWTGFEPYEGQYNYAALDRMNTLIDEFNKYDITVMASFKLVPDWAATHEPVCSPVRKDKWYAYANAVKKLVNYMPNLEYLEFMNEPESAVELSHPTQPHIGCKIVDYNKDGHYSIQEYRESGKYTAQTLNVIAPILKKAGVKAVGGALVLDIYKQEHKAFFKSFAAELDPVFEWITWHIYGYNRDFRRQFLEKLNYVNNNVSGNRVGIWGEGGYLCTTSCGPNFETDKAAELPRIFYEQAAAGQPAAIMWRPNREWKNNGFIVGGKKMPGYFAYQFTASWLPYSPLESRINTQPIKGFSFHNKVDSLYYNVFYNDNDQRIPVGIPNNTKKIYDVYGDLIEFTPGSRTPVGYAPVTIVTKGKYNY